MKSDIILISVWWSWVQIANGKEGGKVFYLQDLPP
jgi:hypothetical protein